MQCWVGMSAGLGWAGLAGGSLGHSDHLRSDVTWDTEIFSGRVTFLDKFCWPFCS